jgi:hypothetical protein
VSALGLDDYRPWQAGVPRWARSPTAVSCPTTRRPATTVTHSRKERATGESLGAKNIALGLYRKHQLTSLRKIWMS